MATVFERLEIMVKELSSKIENLSTEIGEIKTIMGENKSEVNSMFTSFSDIIAERFEELNEGVKSSGGVITSDGISSGAIKELKTLIASFSEKIPSNIGGANINLTSVTSEISELRESVEMLKDAMNYVTDSIGNLSKQIEESQITTTSAVQQSSGDKSIEKVIYKGALRPPPARVAKTTIEPAIRPDIARIYSGVIKGKETAAPTTTAHIETKTIKVESTPVVTTGKVPDHVFELLDSIKGSVNDEVGNLVIRMENVRDEIVKIYKFHPALYELGTFARKLKKYPGKEYLDPDLSSLLTDKINEWKKRLVF